MPMKRRSIIIIAAVFGLLIVIVAVFAVLNAGNTEEKKELENSKSIIVKSGGMEIGTVDMDFIKSAGEKELSAIIDTTNSQPKEHFYTGVPMKNVLQKLGIHIDDYKMFSVKAIDGYVVAFERNEIKDDDNVYIVYKEDGKDLGTKSSGGNGPYQIIVKKDQFGQRWCKYIVEIELVKK